MNFKRNFGKGTVTALHVATRRRMEQPKVQSHCVGDAGCATPAFKKREQVVQHCYVLLTFLSVCQTNVGTKVAQSSQDDAGCAALAVDPAADPWI